jgi:hypothetical protein
MHQILEALVRSRATLGLDLPWSAANSLFAAGLMYMKVCLM